MLRFNDKTDKKLKLKTAQEKKKIEKRRKKKSNTSNKRRRASTSRYKICTIRMYRI